MSDELLRVQIRLRREMSPQLYDYLSSVKGRYKSEAMKELAILGLALQTGGVVREVVASHEEPTKKNESEKASEPLPLKKEPTIKPVGTGLAVSGAMLSTDDSDGSLFDEL